MAAPISLNTIASLEQQVYVAALELQKLELALPADTRPNNTTVTFDTEESTVSIAINLETNMVINIAVLE
jgi:hypothetical protein